MSAVNKDTVLNILRSKTFAVVVSAAASSAGSVLVTRHILRKRYDEIAEIELKEAREYYRKLDKVGEFSDPTELAKDYIQEETPVVSAVESQIRQQAEEIVQKTNYAAVSKDTKADVVEIDPAELIEVKESMVANVFDAFGGEAVYQVNEELLKKSQELPYIVEADTVYENEDNYSVLQWTYYQGDDQLADEEDNPVTDIRGSIGEGNLRFGYGSRDATLVFIANDRRNQYFEVSLSEGKYSDEVAGFIAHSDDSKPGIRKFRTHWDD